MNEIRPAGVVPIPWDTWGYEMETGTPGALLLITGRAPGNQAPLSVSDFSFLAYKEN